MAKKIQTLDIGASSVVLAEFSVSDGSATMLSFGRAELPVPLDHSNAGTVLPPAILEIVREKGIRPGRVAISVPGQMVFPRFSAVAASPGSSRFDQLVRYELEQNVPFALDEMVCDGQVLGETPDGESAVLAVAAKTEQIEAIVSAATSIGFVPEFVDVATLADVNLMRVADGGDGCSLMLDIGAKTTSLAIVEEGRLFSRSVPFAGSTVTKDISQDIGCSLEDAETIKRDGAYVSSGGAVEDQDETLDRVSKVCRASLSRIAAEISRSINFYRGQQGGSEPVKMYLTGGTTLLPGAAEFLSESLGMEAEMLDPFAAVSTVPEIADEAAAAGRFLSVAAGLALRAAGGAAIAVDLMPQSVLDAKAEKKKLCVSAVSGAIATVAMSAIYACLVHGQSVLKEHVAERESRVSALRSMAAKIKKAEAGFEETRSRAEALRATMRRRGAAVWRINAVKQAIGGNELWIYCWEGDRVTIRGWRDRVEAFAERAASKSESGKKQPVTEIVKNRLLANPLVESAKIVDEQGLGRDKCIQQFIVELKFK